MDHREAAWQRRGEIPGSAAGYHPVLDSRRDWGLWKRKRYGSLGTEKPLRQCASGTHPATIPQRNVDCLCTKTEIALANGAFLRYDPYSGGGWLPVQEFRKGGRSASGPAMRRALGKDPCQGSGGWERTQAERTRSCPADSEALSEQGSGAYGTEHRRV